MRSCQVVVIGAGPSGITCARELKASGLSCLILEASGRIGGRIFNSHESTDPVVRNFSKYPRENCHAIRRYQRCPTSLAADVGVNPL